MKYEELEESALKLNELYEKLEIKLHGRAWTTQELALGFMGDVGDDLEAEFSRNTKELMGHVSKELDT